MSKPLAVHQGCSEALCEGLDPVMSQDYSLREAQMKVLLQAQSHTTGSCYGQQLLQQLPELLLGMVWCEKTGRAT